MSWNAIDMANSMRRESVFPKITCLNSVNNNNQSIVWLVVFVMVVFQTYQFISIIGNEDVYIHDFLPLVIVLAGCTMYANDTMHGNSICGIVKLVACIAISHVLIPMMWESPELRKSNKHISESEKEIEYIQ